MNTSGNGKESDYLDLTGLINELNADNAAAMQKRHDKLAADLDRITDGLIYINRGLIDVRKSLTEASAALAMIEEQKAQEAWQDGAQGFAAQRDKGHDALDERSAVMWAAIEEIRRAERAAKAPKSAISSALKDVTYKAIDDIYEKEKLAVEKRHESPDKKLESMQDVDIYVGNLRQGLRNFELNSGANVEAGELAEQANEIIKGIKKKNDLRAPSEQRAFDSKGVNVSTEVSVDDQHVNVSVKMSLVNSACRNDLTR